MSPGEEGGPRSFGHHAHAGLATLGCAGDWSEALRGDVAAHNGRLLRAWEECGRGKLGTAEVVLDGEAMFPGKSPW